MSKKSQQYNILTCIIFMTLYSNMRPKINVVKGKLKDMMVRGGDTHEAFSMHEGQVCTWFEQCQGFQRLIYFFQIKMGIAHSYATPPQPNRYISFDRGDQNSDLGLSMGYDELGLVYVYWAGPRPESGLFLN